MRRRDTALEPAEQMNALNAFDDLAAAQHDGQVHVGAAPHEPFRHDADYRSAHAVQAESAPDDCRISAELPLPESVTKHDNRFCARDHVRWTVGPPKKRRHAHDLEGIGGAVVPTHAYRFWCVGPGDVTDRGGDDALEDRVPLGDLQKLIWRVA